MRWKPVVLAAVWGCASGCHPRVTGPATPDMGMQDAMAKPYQAAGKIRLCLNTPSVADIPLSQLYSHGSPGGWPSLGGSKIL